MSLVSGLLTSSAGVGGIITPSGYGGTSSMYPNSGGATGQQNTGPMGSQFSGSISAQAGNIFEGKASLSVLLILVVGLAGFYVWTHNIQGGG